MKAVFRNLFGFLAVGAIPVSSSMAEAAVRRCSAFYEIEIFASDDAALAPTVTATFGGFQGRGECGNLVPDRCRRRARDQAQACMEEHFLNGAESAPSRCLNRANVNNYNVDIWDDEAANLACRLVSGDELRMRVRTVTTGDTGCGARRTQSEDFRVFCL